jgi:hypothetical protein
MPKTIKFNLNIAEDSVRTLDDLRKLLNDDFKESKCIEELLKFYKNGVLKRWLDVHGYETESESISKISFVDDKDIVPKIVKIVDAKKKISGKLENIRLGLGAQGACKNDNDVASSLEVTLNNYRKKYDELVDKIVQYKDDYPKIKVAVEKLADKFMWLIEFDFERLFHFVENCAPMALFAFVANDKMRRFCVPEFCKNGNGLLDINLNYGDSNQSYFYKSKKIIYEHLKILTTEKKLKDILGKYLKTARESSENCWKNIESNEKKYLILDVKDSKSSKCILRSANKDAEELIYKDIKGMYKIVSGIDVKNLNNGILFYMEV